MRFRLLLGVAAFALGMYVVPALAGDSVSGALVDVLHQKGVLDDASYNDLKAVESSGGDVNKRLIEVLYKKGVLDEASYQKLSGQAAAAAAARTAPVVTQAEATPAKAPVAAERPLDKAITSVEEGIARLGGDTVKLKIGTLIQTGWLSDSAGFSYGSPPTNNFSPTSGNQFFVRRARLFFNGELTPKLGFRVSIEPAVDLLTSTTTSGGRSVLRDAYVWTDYVPYTRLTLGQCVVPFTLESWEALGDNACVNRSLVVNLVQYPTRRDLGVMASGKFAAKVGGLPLGATYAVGAFNGTGYNLSDDNDTKDVAMRGTINPFVEGLNVGASFVSGRTHQSGTVINNNRDRWGAELDYQPGFAKGLKLRGEFVWDRKYYTKGYSLGLLTGLTAGETLSDAQKIAFNRTLNTYGWYLLAAYRVDGLPGALHYLNGFEPVLRYDFMDEDIKTVQNSRSRTTIGLNYYLNKYTRIMLDYELIHADNGLKGASVESIDLITHHLFTTVFQVKF